MTMAVILKIPLTIFVAISRVMMTKMEVGTSANVVSFYVIAVIFEKDSEIPQNS